MNDSHSDWGLSYRVANLALNSCNSPQVLNPLGICFGSVFAGYRGRPLPIHSCVFPMEHYHRQGAAKGRIPALIRYLADSRL